MVKNGFGRIINISSISGLIGTAGQTNYSTSKAAIHGFTRSLAREIAPYNVTINSIAAGYVETEMIETIKEEKLEEIKSQIPLKRFASTLEIAQNVQFLISDAAAYMTGQVLPIDGGLSII
ncbi:MAG: SDR family oxidoreductase, partial [Spirochaetaceae bacterium]|nr:SDR family oxidoreductase [Spirochaetaceae bacterium]